MARIWRWIRCVAGHHDNMKAREWEMAPVFPIRCDNCSTLYYHYDRVI